MVPEARLSTYLVPFICSVSGVRDGVSFALQGSSDEDPNDDLILHMHKTEFITLVQPGVVTVSPNT